MTPEAHEGICPLPDGTTIAFAHYEGPRAGAPRLVLVHSLALDRTVWDGVVGLLAGEAEILTYDCRGHGRSSRRATTFTAELFAADLSALLDQMGWATAAVGGCSMGGCVAMAFAGLYPGRATGLGLIDTTAWYGPDAPAQFRARAESARASGMAGMIEFQLARWFSAPFIAARADVVERTTRVFIANDFGCYARTCALLGDADLRRYLPAFDIPVAIVVGEDDQATPLPMARAMHEAIPRSTLDVLPGAKHLTPIEYPDRVAAALLTVLRRP